MKTHLFLILAALIALLFPPQLPQPLASEYAGTTIYQLNYTDPRSVGLDPDQLNGIDEIVEEAIREGATPGAVVLVLKDGKVVFDRSYGHHTYEDVLPTNSTDIFDLASITKISATTLAVMRLVDTGKLDLDARVGT